jgi:GDP-mannose 6-dehydrogenase
MRISVFGLGYVGTVTAACLAREGNEIVGVDIDRHKIDLINQGGSPIVEEKIADIIAGAVDRGSLKATFDSKAAIHETDLSLVCVGTPSRDNGDVDLSYVLRLSEKIGQVLKNKSDFHTLVYRSTVPPGTTEEAVIPILEETSGKKVYIDFDVCFNPEFLREGSSVHDFYNPPFTVVGQQSEGPGQLLGKLYSFIHAPLELTSIKGAEFLKYICNSYHALKVCFANEIGTLARKLGLDGFELMRLFMLDTKQNLSGMYLKPGFAYGGSCLPKDVRGLLYLAKKLDYDAPLLSAVPTSNQEQLDQGFKIITSLGKKKIGFLGLSFKGGTDDLRESPLVILAERLLGKGHELLIFDRNVNLGRIFGSNKSYIEREIPHIEKLFASSIDDVVYNSEVIVIGNYDEEYAEVVKKLRNQHVVDFARIVENPSTINNYHGICW